jgi:hypothetical protein
MRKTIGFWFLVSFLTCSNQIWAQAQAPDDILAQKLVDGLVAKYQPVLLYLALHVVPPSGGDSVIVAASLRMKIGNKSGCADLHVLSTGIPVLEMKGTSGTLINGTLIGSSVLAPLHDRKGNTIGMLNMGLKFGYGQESEAAKLARSIEQELFDGIPNKVALFERTP